MRFLSHVSLVFMHMIGSMAMAQESGVIGKVGAVEINQDELKSTLGAIPGSEAVTNDPALLKQLVRSLLVQKLLLKQAQEAKWDQETQVVEKIERARIAAITESFLQSASDVPKSYPSDAEVQTAYEANKAAFMIPRQYRMAQIFIASAKGSDQASVDKAKAKLDLVSKALKAKNADFGAVATIHSEEMESANRAGEIGWLTEAQIQPEIRTKLPTLKLDVISEPILLDDGWHIIKVLDIKEPNTPTLDQVRPQLVKSMRAEKLKANSEAYLAKLLEEHPLAINELALGKFISPESK